MTELGLVAVARRTFCIADDDDDGHQNPRREGGMTPRARVWGFKGQS